MGVAVVAAQVFPALGTHVLAVWHWVAIQSGAVPGDAVQLATVVQAEGVVVQATLPAAALTFSQAPVTFTVTSLEMAQVVIV